MDKNKRVARLVGLLFIIGTVSGVLSVVFTSSILETSDYLIKISQNENQFIMATLFVLIMGLSLALVPIVIFPVLSKYNKTLAAGYLVFRGAIETSVYLSMVFTWSFLLIISQKFIADSSSASYLQTFGDVFLKGNESISTILIFVFGIGALMLYWVLYQSKLVPRWLSIWGIVAILLHIATGILIVFNLQNSFSTTNSIMNLPIFLQEMVMAVWLIWKGFNTSAADSKSDK
jgi:hypothetical protein